MYVPATCPFTARAIRVLQTIAAAVPVRLMKRGLLFIAEQMLPLLDEKRVEMVSEPRHQGEGRRNRSQAANRLSPQGRGRSNREADR
jgi:ParB family transcriptional regulator, chromosome partitioning protein